ncbi:pirin family protein [Methylolobus aquaticus]|nr:pirin family protein [Methylolobus aquaticus]
MTTRSLLRTVPSIAASDGAGVKLRRSLGQSPSLRHDPFLMLDEFFSDDPEDYLRGFPAHPHRGFETVTYVLDGHMRHEDNVGHHGDLGPGDVQWMTAGRGIVHSEMPQQTEGRMRGFQLWINLPAREKMKPAAYRDIPAADIPVVALDQAGGTVRVIAGTFEQGGQPVAGPIQGLSTEPLYLDVILPAGAEFRAPVPGGHHAFVYLYEGTAVVGDEGRALPHRAVGILGDGDNVRLQAGSEEARFLLLAGRPLGEPVVQYGPFVMNTRDEIEQALADYRDGTLGAPSSAA